MIKKIKQHIADRRARLTGTIEQYRKPAEEAYHAKMAEIKVDKKEKNRFWLLILSVILITDYLLICYHVDRSPFDIFPSIPELDTRKSVPVYVTDLEGKALLKETRLIEETDDRTILAGILVKHVLKGSDFENTKIVTPIRGFIRNIWFHENSCIIDLRYEPLKDNIEPIPGSEELFRKAVEETIKANIQGAASVRILNNGLPEVRLWDLSVL